MPDDRSLDAVIAELKADTRVELVQRMNVFETQAAGYDDPYAALQTSSSIASSGVSAAVYGRVVVIAS